MAYGRQGSQGSKRKNQRIYTGGQSSSHRMSSPRRLQSRRPSHGSTRCPQTLRESCQFAAARNACGRRSRREAFRPPNLYCRLVDETIGRRMSFLAKFKFSTHPRTPLSPTPHTLKSIQCKSDRDIHRKDWQTQLTENPNGVLLIDSLEAMPHNFIFRIW